MALRIISQPGFEGNRRFWAIDKNIAEVLGNDPSHFEEFPTEACLQLEEREWMRKSKEGIVVWTMRDRWIEPSPLCKDSEVGREAIREFLRAKGYRRPVDV